MSNHPKRPASELRPIAEHIVEELRPYCERIEIAGSLRRRCETVSDIEIVCVPKITTGTLRDLFGNVDQAHRDNALDAFVIDRLTRGLLQHRLDKNGRKSFGEKYKRLLVGDIALDLFSVIEPASWGVIMAIRTGPAEFSRKLVTQRCDGGYLPNKYRVRDGALWRFGEERIEVLEERDLFELIELDYIEPEDRWRH